MRGQEPIPKRLGCQHKGCSKTPSHNYSGSMVKRYCGEHKLDGMVDLYHKKCGKYGCTKNPSFNYEGEPKGRYCKQHKLEGMVDVKSKLCEYPGGCLRKPSCNYPGLKVF